MTDPNNIVIEDHRYFATMKNNTTIEEIDPSSINDAEFKKVSVKSEEELEMSIRQSPCIADLANATNITVNDMNQKISYNLTLPLFCKLLLKNNKESKLAVKYKTTARCLELKIDRNNVVYEDVIKEKRVIKDSYFQGKQPDGIPSIIDSGLINTMLENLQHSLNIHFLGDEYRHASGNVYYKCYDTHDFLSPELLD